jgi:hypothetical protein
VENFMPQVSDDRAYWVSTLDRIVRPLWTAFAKRQLIATMPVEVRPGDKATHKPMTYLEALGRSLTGTAPWLELGPDDTPEGKVRGEFIALARAATDAGTDPASPDCVDFSHTSQALVDSAFLAHAMLRAPKQLWGALEPLVQQNVIAGLKASRHIKPGMSNWLLFSAMVENFLFHVGQDWLPERVDFALQHHMQWYKGDGMYGDGAEFHFDYYNSFVIQPMLIDIIETVGPQRPAWAALRQPILARARRYAAIQERLISPEGTFPGVGRSLAYRFGAFQLLGQMALRRELPHALAPGQVRCGLSAVIRRMIEAPGTFDDHGWLTIGFCGHQPNVAETYISTGSLYLCTAGLIPLGLPATDEFWTCEPMDWTQKRMWSGQDVSADHALGPTPATLPALEEKWG